MKILSLLWAALLLVLSVILMTIDRIIMAPFVNVTLPNMKEIDELPYYRKIISRRVAIYAVTMLTGLMAWGLWTVAKQSIQFINQTI